MVISSDVIIKILLSILFGAIIGWERFRNHKPAGIRTMVLVCLGTMFFTWLSLTYFTGDPLRIIAAIITGIGFLGAGAVISGSGKIPGLTSAASIWIVAAIGVAIAIGEYMLSFIVTIITFFVLELVFIEKRFEKKF